MRRRPRWDPGRILDAISTQPTSDGRFGSHLEESVEEVLRKARPYPPRDELLLDDLTDDEDAAFWETISAS